MSSTILRADIFLIMKKFYFTAIILMMFFNLFAQIETPPDYGNPVIQKGQRNTTAIFMNLMETGNIDSAMKYIDPNYISSNKNLKGILISYSKELKKYLKTTHFSVTIVYPERKYNTYRCRYSNTNGHFFFIDLFFNVGNPNSLIAKIWKKPESQLIKERQKQAKESKNIKKVEAPPRLGVPQ